MKRPSSSGSLAGAGGLIPICPPEEQRAFGRVGSFQSILDGLGEEEEEEMMMMGEDGSGVGLSLSSREKNRRLTVEQVKALEKNFEVENKLEPERKVKLAQELGLQPRQVAVWFQNRRARWKTKQLERDYGVLKSNYDALRSNYDALVHDKESLLAEIKELKAKLAGDGESSHCSIKEEPVVQEEGEELELTHQKKKIKTTTTTTTDGDKVEEEDEDVPPLIYKDGSSDSDSSAILNDFSSAPGVISHQNQLLDEFIGFNCTSSSTSSPFQYPDGRGGRFSRYYYQQQEQQQQMILKMEESEFEPCSSNFFSDEQPPSMPWYCPDQWD